MIAVYFYILWRRLWLIVVTMVFAVAVVAITSYQADLIYRSTATLRVVPFGIGRPDYGTTLYFDQLTNTYSSILQNRRVVEELKSQLGLEELPEYETRVVPNTELMQIVVMADDPQLAQSVALALTDVLLERVSEDFSINFDNIEDTLGSRLNDLDAEISALIRERSEIENEIPINTVRIDEIDRQLQVHQNNYDTLTVSYTQALVAQAAQTGAISVIEPAYLPTEPSNRSLTFWIALGGVMGLVAGAALAFLLEVMQPRFYTDDQIERATKRPILGHVPRVNKRNAKDVFNQDIVAAETLRRLRTTVMAQLGNVPHKSFVMTSVHTSEDKTVISYNLAIAFAFVSNRVLIIDADMRKPRLHELLGLNNEAGLSNLLRGQSSLEAAIQSIGVENLDVMTAGPQAPDSAELLNRPITSELLISLQNHYDVIIIDAPPVLGVTDTTILAPIVGQSVVMVDAESLREDLLSTTDVLEQVNTSVTGIVVNNARRSALRMARGY